MMGKIWRYIQNISLQQVVWALLLVLAVLVCLLIINNSAKDQLQNIIDKQSVSIELLQNEKRELTNDNKQRLLEQSIDKQTIESIRQSLRDRREELGELEKELAFYRGLMTPDDRQRGLSIREFRLEREDGPRVFMFSLVVQQLTVQHKELIGRVMITVEGQQNGIEFNHPLSALSDDVAEEGIDLAFKYFQIVEGRLTLPEGFHPQNIVIEAHKTKGTQQKVSETIPWSESVIEVFPAKIKRPQLNKSSDD